MWMVLDKNRVPNGNAKANIRGLIAFNNNFSREAFVTVVIHN